MLYMQRHLIQKFHHRLVEPHRDIIQCVLWRVLSHERPSQMTPYFSRALDLTGKPLRTDQIWTILSWGRSAGTVRSVSRCPWASQASNITSFFSDLCFFSKVQEFKNDTYIIFLTPRAGTWCNMIPATLRSYFRIRTYIYIYIYMTHLIYYYFCCGLHILPSSAI